MPKVITIGTAGPTGFVAEAEVQEIVLNSILAGDNIFIEDNGDGTITISSSGGGGGGDGLTTEQIQDLVATMLVEGTNVTLTYNDPSNTLTISASGGSGGLTAEEVRDTIAAALVEGSNIDIVYNDSLDTITLSVTGLGITDIVGLQASLNSKASATDLSTLSDEVDDLSDVVDTKASSSSVSSLAGDVANKANASTVTALTTEVSNKAYSSTVAAVQTEVDAVETSVAQHVASGFAHAASTIGYGTGTGVSATNVEAALDELASEKQDVATLTEAIQDMMETFLVEGANIDLVYDDNGNTLTINSALSAEDVRDTIAAALVAGNNIDITVSDVGDTITIDVEGLTSADISDLSEAVDDRVGALVVAGAGASIVYNDEAGTLTIHSEVTQIEYNNLVAVVNSHFISTTAHTAASITYSNASFTATNVNTALTELMTEKADLTGTMLVVQHGSTAGTTRPSGVGVVYWVGSVAPTNAQDLDFWLDTGS